MSFIDIKKNNISSCLYCDVCIIGTGPAGIIIANEFNGSSFDVFLIESGDFKPDAETQSLYDIKNIGYPIRENFMSRVRYYGGTSNIWPGRTMILNKIDLQERDWIPYSGWPIDYKDLINYYKKAAKILNLPDHDKFNISSWNSKMNFEEKSINNKEIFNLNTSLWAKKPLRFGKRYYSNFKRSRNVKIFLNTNLIEIVLSENKKHVERLRFSGLNGKKFILKPKIAILACGGLENPRLLLNSRAQIANGVGNQNDLVGRYYMDHPRAIYGSIRLFDKVNLPLFVGLPFSEGKVQIGIQLSEKIQQKGKLTNSYIGLEPQVHENVMKSYQSVINVGKRLLRRGYSGKRFDFSAKIAEIPDMIYLLTPKEILPHSFYMWYAAIKRKINKRIGINRLKIVNYCEQVPNPNSRVLLDDEKDALGSNKIRLDWKVGNQEIENVLRLQKILGRYLYDKQIGEFNNTSEELVFTDASHHIGTTRMSNDPKRGVVDENCKIHSIDNFYITGSSVFPTSGHANPTLTIVALSLRLADYLKNYLSPK